MNTLPTKAYFPMIGSGYLHLGDGSNRPVAYRTVVSVNDLAGGGILAGNDTFIRRAAKEAVVLLEVGPKHFVGLVVGPVDAGEAPVAVLGTITSIEPIDETRAGS